MSLPDRGRSANRRFAYLHGFASGPLSRKGRHLARRFAERGVELELPDLNRPSFATLSPAAVLAAVDALDVALGRVPNATRWGFVGSSFGGWVAARWAELHPERVERLVLLCPGFDLASRWPVLFGKERMAEWEREGTLALADGAGALVPVHYAFYTESLGIPPWPVVPCETLIVHGTRDEVVPIESSRRYAGEHARVRLIEVDDDHALTASADLIADETLRFFGV